VAGKTRTDATNTVTPLEALLELARSASEDPLPAVLATVAETVRRIAGFTSVALNLFRPAWNDYEVVLVLGSEESRRALLGTSAPSDSWDRLFAEEEQRLPGVFFLTPESSFWDGLENVFRPDIAESDDPLAWQADDGLFVFLSDKGGQPLGFLSMDEPASGRRPQDGDLRLLRAICSHAEQALQSARRNERAAASERMLSQLLGVSPAMSACSTAFELFEEVGDTVVPHLGFERFAAYESGEDGQLELRVTRGWDSFELLAQSLRIDRVKTLLSPAREQAGCWLVKADELFAPALDDAGSRSLRNGRGGAAWDDGCLVVPCRGDGGGLHGLIVIEDPVDRLLPSDDRRGAIRLLVDQVSAAQNGIEHRARLNHLATHDPLTGVRNRRGLNDLVAQHKNVALLVCDLDHFKLVNDRHGHDVGDRVLARFGELLRELARETDVPMRLGGEEFCVVLPNTDRAGAILAAERLRAATSRALGTLVPEGITVSIGVAATARGVIDARTLLAAADRGLYAAKGAGRDRSFAAG
jgi:diguanylate cyclase (GGDEF)-like protein